MSCFVFCLLLWLLYFSEMHCGDTDPCGTGNIGVYPHPRECQLYYNCSLPKEESKPWLGDHVMECIYPDLFIIETLQCGPFQNEDCGHRKIYDHACEYLNNLCGLDECHLCRSDYPCNTGIGTGSTKAQCDHPYIKLLQRMSCPPDERGNMRILDASMC